MVALVLWERCSEEGLRELLNHSRVKTGISLKGRNEVKCIGYEINHQSAPVNDTLNTARIVILKVFVVSTKRDPFCVFHVGFCDGYLNL